MFIAALFTIATTRKPPKCPPTVDWIRKRWCVCIYIYIHTHNGLLLSHKNDIMPFAATWMELETLTLSEIGQKEKDRYDMTSLIYSTNELFHRKENHRHGE